MNGLRMVRVLLTDTVAAAGKLLRFSGSGREGETITDREAIQPYGFQSRPPDGCEGILLRQGNVLMLLAADGRETRISQEKGEVAVVTDEGDMLRFKRNRKMEIAVGSAVKAGELTIDVAGPMQGKVIINAGGQVDISAPIVRLGGMALDTALGIVTGACACSITGAPHAVTSLTAKATL